MSLTCWLLWLMYQVNVLTCWLQVLESFSKCILRNESRSTTNTRLTEKVVALLVDRHADVTRIPRHFQADLLDELKLVSHSKVGLNILICRWFWNYGVFRNFKSFLSAWISIIVYYKLHYVHWSCWLPKRLHCYYCWATVEIKKIYCCYYCYLWLFLFFNLPIFPKLCLAEYVKNNFCESFGAGLVQDGCPSSAGFQLPTRQREALQNMLFAVIINLDNNSVIHRKRCDWQRLALYL